MVTSQRIIFISGSIRKGSYNTMYLGIIRECFSKLGYNNHFLCDLSLYDLPMYNGDLQDREGLPSKVVELKERFLESKYLVIASPEYNSSFSPLLKNTIDWLSRKGDDPKEQPLQAFKGKTALLLSASPGNLGGLRGLYSLRDVLENVGVMCFPTLLTLPAADKAFDEFGKLSNPQDMKKIELAVEDFANLCIR